MTESEEPDEQQRRKEQLAAAWAELDRSPHLYPPTSASVIGKALAHIPDPTVDEIADFLTRVGPGYREVVAPPWLIDFLAAFLSARRTGSLLDPEGGNGLFAASLASRLWRARVDVIVRSAEAADYYRRARVSNARRHAGPYQQAAANLAPLYDAIVSLALPDGAQQGRSIQRLVGSKRSDEFSLRWLLQAAERLPPNGVMIVLVSPSFVWKDGSTKGRAVLGEYGLHLTAMLHLRSGAFAFSSTSLDLAVIERVDRQSLFVAEVPEDSAAQADLVERLMRRQEGASLSQGRIFHTEQYRGYETEAARATLARLAKNKGLGIV